jgi:hypothetical protein
VKRKAGEEVDVVSSTGEECQHQKPIPIYFDSGFDLNFDPAIETYCKHFRTNVIPNRKCGTSCTAFSPFAGIPRSPATADTEAERAANDAHVRAFFRMLLSQVCQKISEDFGYLNARYQQMDREWREADVWLTLPEHQTETLGQELSVAIQQQAIARAESQQLQRKLDNARFGEHKAQDIQWSLQKSRRQMESAAERVKQAQKLMKKREEKEAEQRQRYERWEDLRERLPLLEKLPEQVTRYVERQVESSDKYLSDEEIRHIWRVLKNVSNFATDDVPLIKLTTLVDRLSFQ